MRSRKDRNIFLKDLCLLKGHYIAAQRSTMISTVQLKVKYTYSNQKQEARTRSQQIHARSNLVNFLTEKLPRAIKLEQKSHLETGICWRQFHWKSNEYDFKLIKPNAKKLRKS